MSLGVGIAIAGACILVGLALIAGAIYRFTNEQSDLKQWELYMDRVSLGMDLHDRGIQLPTELEEVEGEEKLGSVLSLVRKQEEPE